ncbi:hypothetical protein KFK09_001146 [Dendrobium nobile]|uniref:Uncharacterized protein n=1 Tax=Dendrobium nobile TaxID=94219 RepID=A0A8T3C7E6_DENNO|nr:hypothetical protein KFK09_001146 [Dendrobium nobile]
MRTNPANASSFTWKSSNEQLVVRVHLRIDPATTSAPDPSNSEQIRLHVKAQASSPASVRLPRTKPALPSSDLKRFFSQETSSPPPQDRLNEALIPNVESNSLQERKNTSSSLKLRERRRRERDEWKREAA